MPVIAIVNSKGGSGKSTLATHLAAHCANAGMKVMLGDVDPQQSTRTWLRLRQGRAPIHGWAVDPRRGLHAPPGTSHVILDTPGGLSGFEMARVVMFADAILMPVCNSVFDRESAAHCHAELLKLPRVATGRCKVAVVGMRLDARTHAAAVLRRWADTLGLRFVGVLRETQAYVRCIEDGLTLFDLPAAQVKADLLQWAPILHWLAPVLHPVAGPATRSALQVTVADGSAAGTGRPVGAAVPASEPAPVAGWTQVPAPPTALTFDCEAEHAQSPARRPPVLTSVVQAAPPRCARLPDPSRRELGEPLPPTLAGRMRGLLDLGPILKRVQRSAWR